MSGRFTVNRLTLTGRVAAEPTSSSVAGGGTQALFLLAVRLPGGADARVPVAAEGVWAADAAALAPGERVLVCGPFRTRWPDSTGDGAWSALLAELLAPAPDLGGDVNWWHVGGAVEGAAAVAYEGGEPRAALAITTRREEDREETAHCVLYGHEAERIALAAGVGRIAWGAGPLGRVRGIGWALLPAMPVELLDEGSHRP